MSKSGETARRAPGRDRGSKREWFIWGLGAMGVGLTASLLNILLFHSYPILVPEVGIVWVILMACALLFAIVLADVRFSIKVALGGFLALLLADWNMASIDWPFVAGVAGLLFTYRMGVDFFRLVTVAFAVIGMTSLLGLGQDAERIETVERELAPVEVAEEPPLLVHLILDEFEGVRGLDAMPGHEGEGEAMAASLMEHGFTVYDDAHTQYYHSVTSIPMFLNYGELGESFGNSDVGGVTGATRWFSDLRAAGYDIDVVQSSFVDLCEGNEVQSCRTYWRENLQGIREAEVSTGDRARLIFIHIGRQLVLALVYSGVIENIIDGNFLTGEISVHAPLKHRGEANTINSVHELERVADVVKDKGPGDAIVAHVLAPHFPYSHDEDCKTTPVTGWQTAWQSSSEETRAAAYVAQVRCVTGLIGRVADAADAASGGNYVMIVNGDHGSRLGREMARWGMDQGSEAQWLHAGSTLFAVKLQTPAPGRMKGPASLAELLEGTDAGQAQVPHEPEGVPPTLLEPPDPDGRTFAPIALDWQ
ncbi:hypothetical protein [Sphingomicrobium clamense]|uniref:Sulfatase N-terminal domain-containing protein n=1 Tax=Sphingomicrobium clamense TaxID=2851013 RepID=A0ABS6V2E2_9SPHN|nr:hypothetical protein [Sphingomicrobium sp. B8]MBW0143733.1 hypothetical protein [Sphingomicrobium sp. B8]